MNMDKMVGGDFERGLKKLGEVGENRCTRDVLLKQNRYSQPPAAPPASPAP